MLLAIDCGNTNTLFAIHNGIEWIARWRIATSAVRTADEYSAWLSSLMAMATINMTAITDCIIATVVPQSLFHLRNLSKRYFKQTPLVIGENVIPDISVKIDNPLEAGADRLVNAVAAHKKYPHSPLLVIDSGTATTFDVIASDGSFLGGVICPGLSLSVLALHNAAAKLPRVEIKETEKVIGKNTVHAMQAGIFWGYIGLIEGLVTRIRSEYAQQDSKQMTVIGTGGIVPLFAGATDYIDVFDTDLTLDGLLEIYQQYTHNIHSKKIENL